MGLGAIDRLKGPQILNKIVHYQMCHS